MTDDVETTGVPSDVGPSPPAPDDGAGLGLQGSPELGSQGQQAPQLPTVESLQAHVKTLDKRFGDLQTALHEEKAAKAALQSRLESGQAVIPRQAPQQQFDPFGGLSPEYDPQQAGLTPRELALWGAVGDSRVEIKMERIEKELGFPVSDGEKQAIRDHLNAIGSSDVSAGAKVVLHERIKEQAAKSAKAATLSAVKQSSAGVVQMPAGQTGQPKREYPRGLEGYDEIWKDAGIRD